MPAKNHYISVSREGRLLARRAGGRQVQVCDGAGRVRVTPDPEALAAGVPAELVAVVRHDRRAHRREVMVEAVLAGGEEIETNAFLERFALPGERLGRWLRAAVEAALDRAEQAPPW